MNDSAVEQLRIAIRDWMKHIEDYPGWREWTRERMRRTLFFDDDFMRVEEKPLNDFTFDAETEKQHKVIMLYFSLQSEIESLKTCQYYFRRYPFRGLPVSRYDHARNACEMYFARFYSIKSRLKNYLNALAAVAPNHKIEVGKFLKVYEREFDQELRERNGIHHHDQFGDIAIDRLIVTELVMKNEDQWQERHKIAYRKFAAEWTKRVVKRSEVMDKFLEAVAKATIETCPFLSGQNSLS